MHWGEIESIYLMARPSEGTRKVANVLHPSSILGEGADSHCSIMPPPREGADSDGLTDVSTGGGALIWNSRVSRFSQDRAPSLLSLAVRAFSHGIPCPQKNPRLLPKGSLAGEIPFIYSGGRIF